MRRSFLLAVASALLSAQAGALPGPDIVYVRKSCTGIANCFTGTTAMANWIRTTRQPTQADPLLVDIGPGEWDGFKIEKAQYTTFRGAGQSSTFIRGNLAVLGSGTTAVWGIGIASPLPAHEITFQSMTLEGGINWDGGNSTWSDVNVVAQYWGWDDRFCAFGGPLQANARHYWYGSKLSVDRATAGTAVAVLSLCGQTWFYGGEVQATVTNAGSGISYGLGALDLQNQAEFYAFGTAIRVDPGVLTDADIPGALGSNAIWGVRLRGDSHFHMHGGIVNVSTNTLQNADALGIQIDGEGAQFAHTPGTAFVLRPGSVTGTPIRILTGDPAKVQSPFQWQSGTRPPQAPSEASTLVSTDGSDLYVETDCSTAGDCNGGGNQAHLMVHNPTECTDPANAWLDTVTGRCRNDTTP